MSVIAIIGATSGIGRAIAEKAVAEGHTVHSFSRSSATSPEFSHQYYNALDPTSTPIHIPEKVDHLIYTPGSINLKPFHRISNEEWLQEFNINVLGAVQTIRLFLPALKQGTNSSITLFSSVAAQTGMPFHASIASMKGAIEGLTRSLAAEFAPHIRVNAIAPSLTETPLAEKLTATPEKKESAGKRHPLQRIGTVEDQAEAAMFLMFHAPWMTGQILKVDGGLSALKI
jgi:NAD(P)-dependent dehydrogenase (short-subunit alcohol dehydrogenase family)